MTRCYGHKPADPRSGFVHRGGTSTKSLAVGCGGSSASRQQHHKERQPMATARGQKPGSQKTVSSCVLSQGARTQRQRKCSGNAPLSPSASGGNYLSGIRPRLRACVSRGSRRAAAVWIRWFFLPTKANPHSFLLPPRWHLGGSIPVPWYFFFYRETETTVVNGAFPSSLPLPECGRQCSFCLSISRFLIPSARVATSWTGHSNPISPSFSVGLMLLLIGPSVSAVPRSRGGVVR